jgi:hypothetical protein
MISIRKGGKKGVKLFTNHFDYVSEAGGMFHESTVPPIDYPNKKDSHWRPRGITYIVGKNAMKREKRELHNSFR